MTSDLSPELVRVVADQLHCAALSQSPATRKRLAIKALTAALPLLEAEWRMRSLPMQGHDQPCYYCGKPCDDLAGSPSRWPVALCHADDPGKVKWHHTGCVTERLVENQPLLETYLLETMLVWAKQRDNRVGNTIGTAIVYEFIHSHGQHSQGGGE